MPIFTIVFFRNQYVGGNFPGEDCALMLDNSCWDDARCERARHEYHDVHALCEAAANGGSESTILKAYETILGLCLCLLLCWGNGRKLM